MFKLLQFEKANSPPFIIKLASMTDTATLVLSISIRKDFSAQKFNQRGMETVSNTLLTRINRNIISELEEVK